MDLFVMMLPKAHLTSHSRVSGSRWVITPSWFSGSWRSFLYSSSVYSCHLFLISSASVRSIPFLSFIVPIFAWNVLLVSLIFLRWFLVFPILLFSCFFASITEEGFLISSCYSLDLCIQVGILPYFTDCFWNTLYHGEVLNIYKSRKPGKWALIHFYLPPKVIKPWPVLSHTALVIYWGKTNDPNSAIYNSIHLLSQSFCGVGLLMVLLWILWISHKTVVIAHLIWRVHFQAYSSGWQDSVARAVGRRPPFIAFHVDISTEHLTAQNLHHQMACGMRTREWARREIMVFFLKFSFGCTGSSFLYTGFLWASWGSSFLWCVGFSLQWLFLLWSMGSRVLKH